MFTKGLMTSSSCEWATPKELFDKIIENAGNLHVHHMEQFGPDNCPEDVLGMWRQKGGALDYENVIGHAIEPNFAMSKNKRGSAKVNVVPGHFAWRTALLPASAR